MCVLTNFFMNRYQGMVEREVILLGHEVPLFLTRTCSACVLFAGWKEASAGCVMGVGRWSSCCRRQNKGNKSFQSSMIGSETPDHKERVARGSTRGFNKGGSC